MSKRAQALLLLGLKRDSAGAVQGQDQTSAVKCELLETVQSTTGIWVRAQERPGAWSRQGTSITVELKVIKIIFEAVIGRTGMTAIVSRNARS